MLRRPRITLVKLPLTLGATRSNNLRLIGEDLIEHVERPAAASKRRGRVVMPGLVAHPGEPNW